MKGFSLVLLLLVGVLVSGCARDVGFSPRCLEERVWDDARGAVVLRKVCTVPAFYQRICKECGHAKPAHFPWCDPTRRRPLRAKGWTDEFFGTADER
jgi:hypothetical protein